MPVNVALLGSGIFAAQAYIPALQAASSSSFLNLHTIWTRKATSIDNILQKATEAGLKPATLHGDAGLTELLENKEIDAVMLVLPITTQPGLVIRALKAGKHVLCEKPLAKDTKDARELIETYERDFKDKGLIYRIAESTETSFILRGPVLITVNWHHEPVLHKVAGILRDPKVGPVLYWQMLNTGTVLDGSSWQSTEWRTIPDYQGGM